MSGFIPAPETPGVTRLPLTALVPERRFLPGAVAAFTLDAEGPDGLTLDELTDFLNAAGAAGVPRTAVVRVRARRGVVHAVTAEGPWTGSVTQ